MRSGNYYLMFNTLTDRRVGPDRTYVDDRHAAYSDAHSIAETM